ncbi:MAG: FG-GAP repeat protein [Flavobacteriales bacterium]|nr:FG-GAP repeat protein [Flavobacteriales bacterium]
MGPQAPAGYAITALAGTYRSANAAHGLVVAYRKDGFDLEVPAGAAGRSCGFTLEAIGKGAAAWHINDAAPPVLDGGRLAWDHGSFRMLYTNTPAGMRHDLEVLERPAGEGRLEARFQISGGLQALQARPDEVVFHRFDPQRGELVPMVRYSGLKCWDATGRILPSRMELEADELVLAVEDHGAVYPVTIDPLSNTANLQLNGTQTGEQFGHSVATAGDVDGDGYSDVLVGSPNWSTPFANAGRVQLFLGSSTGLAATAAWTLQGTQANARMGFSVGTAGDVNGDGYSDVAIGSPGMLGWGGVLVYAGSSAGLGGSAWAVLMGNSQTGSEFGWSVALAGDVDGDGLSDLVVGAPKYNNGSAAQGRAYCYHGSAVSMGPVANWTFTGIPVNGQLGYCVAGAGDLNGDGYSDVAIGAPFQPKVPTTNNGAVHVFRGNLGSGLSVAAGTVLQGPGSSNFGSSVSSAGDMNGDGFADLVIGAPGTSTNAGAVHIHMGVGAITLVASAAASTLAGTSGERLGHAVALAGDVNGDGYGDVVLGSPDHSSALGRARVYRGSAAPLLDATHLYWTGNGSVAGAKAGSAVATAGDVNGDGLSDLLVGAPEQGGTGAVKIFHGVADLPHLTNRSWTIQGTADHQRLGHSVASAGDVNADGYSDVVIGIPGSGTGWGKVEVYYGSPTGLPALPSWSQVGENINDGFGHSVASAGDVDGDGYSDVLVGAPSWPFGVENQWRGRVYLFRGSASGLVATAAWTMDGPLLESRFGYSLSSAGDVNGDGYSDVVIGAYSYEDPGVPSRGAGAAYVFHGSATGLPTAADWSTFSQQFNPSSTSEFGSSVSLAGDVNGDGYDDVIIGDPYYEHVSDGGNNRGGAFVYHGSPTGLPAAPDWSAFGVDPGDEFGNSVCYAGDVNGDGHSDVVIGAYLKGTDYQGGAYVFHGAPTTGLGSSPAWAINGTVIGDRMGNSVCSAGDVNGDGFGDVVIGTSLKDWAYQDGGGVELFLGSPTGLPATAAWYFTGGMTGEQLGVCVALAGDVNGDGYSDLVAGGRSITGSPYTQAGAASLFLGNMGRALPSPIFQYRSNLTTPVRTGNGTFQNDCAWGIGQFARSSLGRGKMRLVWQVAGHGPFVPTNFFPNNSTAFTGEELGWTDGLLSGVLLKEPLSTVAGTTSHPAWRARIRFHPATALDGRMFGRWFRQGIHDLQVPSIKTELAGCGPLPVTLVAASVRCEAGQAVVEWTTATEQDCAAFLVQRSTDAETWETIGQVACSGNSSQLLHYRFVDLAPLAGTVGYYRLKQVDVNGAFEVFPAMALVPCGGTGNLPVWPNPFGDVLYVALPVDLREPGPVAVVLRDMAGRVALHRTYADTDRQVITITGCSVLPPGTYRLEVVGAAGERLGVALVVRS